MEVLIIREPVSEAHVRELAGAWHGLLVKGVADIERGVIALGGEWHMDANVKLIEDGSSQEHVWGFNVYPDERGDTALEYLSLINIRPAQGNRSLEIQDTFVRSTVHSLVARLIPMLDL